MLTETSERTEYLSRAVRRNCRNIISEDDSDEKIIHEAAEALIKRAADDGRIAVKDVLAVWEQFLAAETDSDSAPEEGWLMYTYRFLRGRLFPHLKTDMDTSEGAVSCVHSLLGLLRAVYDYERESCSFDPRKDIHLLSNEEIRNEGFTSEYLKMKRIIRENYVYEFMRLGSEITPFNTLGHIGGVHYIAMYVARQLWSAGIPVDLGLISAAAASHDIGKYGCRKHEERRVPYLHYYYTDYCLRRYGLKGIAHIAANHSVWDLELENLSVESLLLIYADFRSKSTRENGVEKIHFYSLKQAFDVILSKLDNVDSAKRLRYIRVYNKLKDFEDYMIEHGVSTEIPDDADAYPLEYSGKNRRIERKKALLGRREVTEQIKYLAIDHNIRVMNRFGSERQFASLLESARSDTDWKNTRTYISILREYSTYMTDSQKALSLRFLYDALSHQESDIREQTADTMGFIVAKYRVEYKKELPEDIPAQDDNTSNLTMFRQYIELLLNPDRKYTDMHRKWIISSTDFFVRSVISNCRPSCRHKYFDILQDYYSFDENMQEERIIILMSTALMINPSCSTDSFRACIKNFADEVEGQFSQSTDLITLKVKAHFGFITSEELDRERRRILGLGDDGITDEQLSAIFLDDLKMHVTWIVKSSNISIMRQSLEESGQRGRMLQIATHFANLIKVSETVTVRKEASEALLSIFGRLPMDQRNELMIELVNGLEREDFQFAGLIPDCLGLVMLHLKEGELDEVIYELGKMIHSANENIAGAALNTLAVALEHYSHYGEWIETEVRVFKARKLRLIGLLMKGLASYRKEVSREAMRALSVYIFASTELSLAEKRNIASHCFKRLLTIMPEAALSDELDFYNNAAALNNIYRYITEFRAEYGEPHFEGEKPAVFFPGTFDPFSLGHKAIAVSIRDMGFDVYLAIDEFSWSKKTLPHNLRKRILQMSVADQEGLYIFPDDISVNIANPEDLGQLRKLFPQQDLYIAVGSDVVMNASAYKNAPQPNSIHTFNHIIFAREARKLDADGKNYPVSGKVINLTLDKFYEDISSTRIRDNVDLGRDISNLIDPIAQQYIYDRNLYVREPAYKHEVQARELNIHTYGAEDRDSSEYLENVISNIENEELAAYLSDPDVSKVIIETADRKVSAAAGAVRIRTSELLAEFGDIETAAFIRDRASGAIAVIGAFYVRGGENVSYLRQILLTELLAMLMERDYSYAVFHPVSDRTSDQLAISTLIKQGFVNISEDRENPVYAADMRNPIAIFRDADTVIKAPLNKNASVQKAFDKAHDRLLEVFREIYPGKLLMSFNTSAVYSKIVELVAEANGVSTVPDPLRRRGPYLAVPFGKALPDVVVPNTVTKALRTEKYFSNDLESFDIRESRGYQTLDEQAGTIHSFGRPVILIDDLLHSGQRMNKIDPILRSHDVIVHKVIVGLLTGNARDRMKVFGRDTECAYFIPSISLWLNERDCYPFIGGDSIDNPESNKASGGTVEGGWHAMRRRPDAPAKEGNASVNLILPYTGFGFIGNGEPENIYKYSLVCLENAADILRTLEQEYQNTFEKKLTVRRLGAVVTYPRRPILGFGLEYDDHVAPSVYVENEIRKVRRMFLFNRKR